MTTNPDTHPRELCGYEHGCSGCAQPKCEICERTIRRDHSSVQLSAGRVRHHVCHERAAEAPKTKDTLDKAFDLSMRDRRQVAARALGYMAAQAPEMLQRYIDEVTQGTAE